MIQPLMQRQKEEMPMTKSDDKDEQANIYLCQLLIFNHLDVHFSELFVLQSRNFVLGFSQFSFEAFGIGAGAGRTSQ